MLRALACLLCVSVISCGVSDATSGSPEGELDDAASALTLAQKRVRSDQIKAAARTSRITNTVLIAGIANHESGLAQCWSEAPWHCQGPWSPQCGGPSMAGSGDGPCSIRQGGIGMFQLDSGTHSQTLASYGADVVDVAGNVRAGVDVIVHKVRVCPNTPAFGSDAEVIDWINSARVGTARYETFLTAMAWCYNGCAPSFTSCSHAGVRAAYRSGIESLLNAFGAQYWDDAGPGGGGAAASATPVTAANVGRNTDGRLEVFVRGADLALWHQWQLSPVDGWSGWSSLGGELASQPVVARNADGRLEVFVIGTDGALHHRWQQAEGGWGGWASLGGANLVGELAAVSNADGRLEVFARTSDGGIWHKWQAAPGDGFSDWRLFGGFTRSDPVIGKNADGRLELFVRGGDDQLWHAWQLEPNGGWSDWSALGGVLTSAPAVQANADGRLEVFHTGTDGALYHRWQSSGGWLDGWAPLGGSHLIGAPFAARNGDGRIEVFVRTEAGLFSIWQMAANGGWHDGFVQLGGPTNGWPTVLNTAGGALELFVRGTDDAVWHTWQDADGWSDWHSLGGEVQ